MGSNSLVNPLDTEANAELDQAFAKVNMYLYATENKLVQKLMYKNLEELSKEAIKRDNSLKNKLQQYLISLKGYLK